MGTRADFYVGRGETAEWLGSIAYDGYPDGVPKSLRFAADEAAFRVQVEALMEREDATRPADGWPWPWDDSRTTDYAYAFDGAKVHASCFGGAWFNPMKGEPKRKLEKVAVFPNMKSRANVSPPGAARSGCMVVISLNEERR